MYLPALNVYVMIINLQKNSSNNVAPSKKILVMGLVSIFNIFSGAHYRYLNSTLALGETKLAALDYASYTVSGIVSCRVKMSLGLKLCDTVIPCELTGLLPNNLLCS